MEALFQLLLILVFIAAAYVMLVTIFAVLILAYQSARNFIESCK